MSLVWCSLGARGRNCLIEGVLPFSRVASKGTVKSKTVGHCRDAPQRPPSCGEEMRGLVAAEKLVQ